MCCNSFKDLIIQYTTSIGSSPKIHDMWTARCEIICFIYVVKLLFHESIYISLGPYRKSYRYESLNQGWQSKVCRYSYKARKFLISQYNTHLHLSYTKNEMWYKYQWDHNQPNNQITSWEQLQVHRRLQQWTNTIQKRNKYYDFY